MQCGTKTRIWTERERNGSVVCNGAEMESEDLTDSCGCGCRRLATFVLFCFARAAACSGIDFETLQWLVHPLDPFCDSLGDK
jgi:hypothetical protein